MSKKIGEVFWGHTSLWTLESSSGQGDGARLGTVTHVCIPALERWQQKA